MVPIGYPLPAATVYQAVAFAPDAVFPYPGELGSLPHSDAVYADAFIVFTIGSIPFTLLARSLLDGVGTVLAVLAPPSVPLLVTFTICSIFCTGSFIVSSFTSVLPISMSF